MKLVHKSGSIRCNPNKPASYGGCTNEPLYGNSSLMTIITNAKKELILPPAGDLQAHSGCNNKKHFYSINGSTHTSPGLVFRDLLNVASVSRKQEIQMRMSLCLANPMLSSQKRLQIICIALHSLS